MSETLLKYSNKSCKFQQPAGVEIFKLYLKYLPPAVYIGPRFTGIKSDHNLDKYTSKCPLSRQPPPVLSPTLVYHRVFMFHKYGALSTDKLRRTFVIPSSESPYHYIYSVELEQNLNDIIPSYVFFQIFLKPFAALDMDGFDVFPDASFVLTLSVTHSALPHVEPLLRLHPHHQLQRGQVLLVHLHLVDARVEEQGRLTVFSLDMFSLDMSPRPGLVVTAKLTG